MRTIVLVVFSFLTIGLFAGNEPVDKTRQAKEWLKNQPLSFIENKGQLTNTDGNPADNVLFKASYGDCDIYITTEGISYVFVKYDKMKGHRIDTNDIHSKFGQKEMENKTVSYYRLDMNLQGSSINKTQIIKELPGKQGVTNYFYPHCPEGIYGVQEYGKITIKNIYKGIDWVIYTNAENKEAPLKYDFVVQPQANYKDIKIKFVNAQSTLLTDNGTKLKIQTIAGNIEEGNLYSYLQNSTAKQSIKTTYIANSDSTLEFELGAYDKTKTLVIDPLVWATYYGGSGEDEFYAVSTDAEDNLYITGKVGSSDFPNQNLSSAFWQPTNQGNFDAVILKFDSQGIRQWSTYYGGSLQDQARSICTDTQGNVYVTGETNSINFPLQKSTNAYYQGSNRGEYDIFILKFTKNGVRQSATYYGGISIDSGPSVCTDKQDNVYITGTTFSENFPTTKLAGAYNQPTKLNYVSDGFILKFNSDGTCQWSTFYGGSNGEDIRDLLIDSQENLYITGGTSSLDFPFQKLEGAYFQDTIKGYDDVFIVKFNKLGNRQWATVYGGSIWDDGYSLCSDSQDNIYITGNTYSTNFPVQQLAGAYNQSYSGGEYDIFVLKFDNLGACKWATYYGGSNYETGTTIRSDSHDNIYITGDSYSTNFPTKELIGEYWQPSKATGYSDDAIILKFSETGTTIWATYYGGLGSDAGLDLVVDSQNSLYYVGRFGEGAYTLDYGNDAYYDNSGNVSYDGFILKFDDCNNQKPSSVQTDRNDLCINETGNIILTAIGGIGDTLKWYSDKAGLNYLGKDTPFTVPIPSQTTTYYARWESLCDTSECDSVVISILTQFTKNISPAICEGDTCTVGTSKYTKAGIYIDLLSTASGCDSIVTTNLFVNPSILIATNPPICEGETFTVGSNVYTLAGTYKDVFKTYLGCDSTVVTNLVVNPLNRTSLTRSICQGDSYIVGTKIYTATGIYSDTLSSVLFCDSIVTTNLTVHPAYQLTPSPFICPGETVTVGTHTYSATGTYIDKLSTTNGCDSIITTNLTVYPVEQNIQSPIRCTGESITVGLNTYTETGTYTDVLTSHHNCDSTVITNLTINPTAQSSFPHSICEGETFIVGTNIYSSPGNYIDVLKTSLGCDSTVTTALTVNPVPEVSLGDDQLLCQGDTITLSAGTGFINYLWSDGSVLSDLKVTSTGKYFITVYNEWCPASDEITIKECGTEIWFPNAFSPNNDYTNEYFKPVILGTLYTYHIIIYNRWGQQIYESNDARTGWNGTFNGSDCATGPYVYVATYSMGAEAATRKQGVKRGPFTLLR
ncbi:MAG: SBBP repeat-containing protein [Bacteroidales bacterium]|nr:SBBP repeat-containing protein [Bacteroidales bacterium]